MNTNKKQNYIFGNQSSYILFVVLIHLALISSAYGATLLDNSYFSWLDTTWMTTLWSMFSIVYGAGWAFFNYYCLIWTIQIFSVWTV